jgi:hypothetical protein
VASIEVLAPRARNLVELPAGATSGLTNRRHGQHHANKRVPRPPHAGGTLWRPPVRTRVLETVAPARLGHGFRWLLSSAVVNNLGDGIGLAAGPLLLASLTRDPLLVSMAVLLQRLPFLLFGFFAGAVADRIDRRDIVVAVDLLRAVTLVAHEVRPPCRTNSLPGAGVEPRTPSAVTRTARPSRR